MKKNLENPQQAELQEVELQEVNIKKTDTPDEIKDFNVELIADVKVSLDVKLGDVELTVAELNTMLEGQAFKLNQSVDEPVQLILNDKVIGLGKLVVVDNQFGIELIKINN